MWRPQNWATSRVPIGSCTVASSREPFKAKPLRVAMGCQCFLCSFKAPPSAMPAGARFRFYFREPVTRAEH